VNDASDDGAFALAIRHRPDQVIVSVHGDLDLLTAPALRCVLKALVEQSGSVVLDLAGLAFMDASGLGVLASTANALSPGRVVSIRTPSVAVRRLLAITGLPPLVELEPLSARPSLLGREQTVSGLPPFVASEADARLLEAGALALAHPTPQDVVDAALRLVTALAQATIRGADGVSVSLTRDDRVVTVAASDDTIAQMDRDQYATGQGPCLAAATEGHWFHVESLGAEDRWPEFTARARQDGIASILSTPLMVADRPVGALNIYSGSERAFGPHEQELAGLFATQASDVLAGADGPTEATARRLRDALEMREVIAQAQGVLMAREGVSAEVAYGVLRQSSRRADLLVRHQAAAIVASTRSGELLGPVAP
jgi:anti-anti-sigma factor